MTVDHELVLIDAGRQRILIDDPQSRLRLGRQQPGCLPPVPTPQQFNLAGVVRVKGVEDAVRRHLGHATPVEPRATPQMARQSDGLADVDHPVSLPLDGHVGDGLGRRLEHVTHLIGGEVGVGLQQARHGRGDEGRGKTRAIDVLVVGRHQLHLVHLPLDALIARGAGDESVEGRVDELKLVTPHYQHVDGTSFATPLVAAAVACLLEANPGLDPAQVRDVLQATAETIPGVPIERQGHGVLDVGQAIALARHLRRGARLDWRRVPQVTPDGILYALDYDDATQVELLGSWDGWQPPGLLATETEPGLWIIYQDLLPAGVYQYKFQIDGQRWLLDPSNRARVPDGAGGLNSVLTVP